MAQPGLAPLGPGDGGKRRSSTYEHMHICPYDGTVQWEDGEHREENRSSSSPVPEQVVGDVL